MSIEINKLSYTYTFGKERISALSDITLSIGDGEFVGIMGPTGCGKSTFLQILAGLLEPETGKVILDGDDINAPSYNRALLRKKVGMVFQYPEYQLFETTVEKDVAFGLRHSGLSSSEIKERVQWALEVMGFSFEKIGHCSPLSLSGGEKRRVAIAGVLATKPKYLIFDEPLAGLDAYARQDFMKLVTSLNKENMTIIMVSHNTDYLFEYASRILIFEEGHLLMDRSPEELFAEETVEEPILLPICPGGVRRVAGHLHQEGILPHGNLVKYQDLLDHLVLHLGGGEDR